MTFGQEKQDETTNHGHRHAFHHEIGEEHLKAAADLRKEPLEEDHVKARREAGHHHLRRMAKAQNQWKTVKKKDESG